METIIITATSAAMGIIEIKSLKNTTIISKKRPAKRVESLVRPPDFTLITDYPIMAQPAYRL